MGTNMSYEFPGLEESPSLIGDGDVPSSRRSPLSTVVRDSLTTMGIVQEHRPEWFLDDRGMLDQRFYPSQEALDAVMRAAQELGATPEGAANLATLVMREFTKIDNGEQYGE